MIGPREFEVPPAPLERFLPLVGEERYARLSDAAGRMRALLGSTAVWNVNSTHRGGGVAEMLQVLLGYSRGAGLDMRWLVVGGDDRFFALTKRIHNRVHGIPGDDGALDGAERAHYDAVLADNAAAVLRWVRPGDVVLLHDPQTLGLAAHLRRAGATAIWRSHIGVDHANEWTAQAWDFLRPLAEPCDAFVFSRAQYVPGFLDDAPVSIIAPSIDPFSPKNQDLAPDTVAAVLRAMGLTAGRGGAGPRGVAADGTGAGFTRADGSPGRVGRRAEVVGEGPPLDPEAPLVVQVSRWDHLKDMHGVLTGFAAHVAGRHDAQLALVGPAVHDVSDDPEGATVLAECVAAWGKLSPRLRRTIRLVTLPMDDTDENAAMVNALQRHATVVVQKSLAEGFGLTVAEGMWKARPMLASAVGGIVDQVVHDTGVLLPDPTDLDAYGLALDTLLGDPAAASAIGTRAHDHVREHFLGDRHLLQYAELLESVVRV